MKSFAIIVFLGIIATSYGATFEFSSQADAWGSSSGDIAAGAGADEVSGVGGGGTDGDGTVFGAAKAGFGIGGAFGTAFGAGALGADESPGSLPGQGIFSW